MLRSKNIKCQLGSNFYSDLQEGMCDETSFGGCVDSLFCRS